MPTVQLPDGATIWYTTQGSGTPLLQVHGSAFGHRNFAELTPHLAPHAMVIDIDLPGYGESRGGPPPESLADIAEQLALLVPALGYDRMDVHGTSFGGMLALTLAARHPELVDRLVLSCLLARYDNAARMMRGTWKRAALGMGMAAVADLTSVAGFARSFYDRPGAGEQLESMRVAFADTVPAAFVAGTEAIERTDLSGLAAQVTAPTLLLAGAEDNMTPFHPAGSGFGMAQLAELLPDNRCEVLPECGHYLVIEQPERAAALIGGFLGSAGR